MVAIYEALVEAIKRPESVCALSLEQWDELFVVSRATELFGRLAVRIEQAGLLETVPSPVQRQLRAAIAYAQYERQQAYWDVGLVRRALRNVKTPIVLLKGAAYHLADLDVAAGRKNRDVDILVAAEYLTRPKQPCWIRTGKSLSTTGTTSRTFANGCTNFPLSDIVNDTRCWTFTTRSCRGPTRFD